MATHPEIERGLHASVKVYDFAKTALATNQETVTISREQLTELRKAGLAMNRSLTRFAKEAFAIENRLLLELHMLRGIMKRENTDRDANRARVYELFRRFNASDGGDGASASTVGANPLNAPTPTAVAIDKALAGLERLEQSMRDVSPVGRVNIHGAGLLAAKLKRDALVAAAAAEGQPGTSSEC